MEAAACLLSLGVHACAHGSGWANSFELPGWCPVFFLFFIPVFFSILFSEFVFGFDLKRICFKSDLNQVKKIQIKYP
jgi:hypothetical protein